MGVEDTVNNLDVDDGQKEMHAVNVDHGYKYGQAYTCTWSDVVSRCTFG